MNNETGHSREGDSEGAAARGDSEGAAARGDSEDAAARGDSEEAARGDVALGERERRCGHEDGKAVARV